MAIGSMGHGGPRLIEAYRRGQVPPERRAERAMEEEWDRLHRHDRHWWQFWWLRKVRKR
jgi:hypothetical protein